MSDHEWWRGATIYQIYPRSFQDSNGDGVGDLAGITHRLDYIASLGFDGIWISPFFKSPMKDFGYDVSDYRDVDPLFGTIEDFDSLLNKAHAIGLKVVIDMVLSHTSNRHQWFQESRKNKTNRKADWYVWADAKPDGSPPNNWRSVFGGEAWEFDTTRGQYYLHNFLKEQPDLNYNCPEIHDQMLRNCRYWLERGVDGFRLDAVNFIYNDARLRDNPPADPLKQGYATQFNKLDPYSMQKHIYDKSRPEALSFLKKLRALSDEYGSIMLLAEICDLSQDIPVEYTNGPDKLHTAYSLSLLGQEKLTPQMLGENLQNFISDDCASWPSWAFSNHDVIRPVTRWGDYLPAHARKKFPQFLIALLLSLRGTIFMYQGEELGLPEASIAYEKIQDPWGKYLWPEWQGRDGCRTPMPWEYKMANGGFTNENIEPWLPLPPEHDSLAVDRQEKNPSSTLNFTRKAIEFRKNNPVLRTGKMSFTQNPAEDLIAFIRSDGNHDLVCLFNLGDNDRDIDIPGYHPVTDQEGLTAQESCVAISGHTINLPAFDFCIQPVKKN